MIRPALRVFLFLMLVFAALAGVSSTVTPARAATVVVSTCDFATLYFAIEDAAEGGTITFACSGTIDAGFFTTHQYDIDKDLTIDGTGQNVILDGGGQSSIFLANDVTFTLRGLTFINGTGGSYSSCEECPTADYGGVVTQVAGTLNIIDSTFINNEVRGLLGGGVILNVLGTLNISNSTFSDNFASWDGGAVLSLQGTVNISNSTFNNNTTNEAGGAISNRSGDATISGSTFSGNVATPFNANGAGGAISHSGSSPMTIVNSTFYGNRAEIGGAIANANSTIDVIHSTLVGNVAALYGNGVVNGQRALVGLSGGGTTRFTNTILANADVPSRGSDGLMLLGNNCGGRGTYFIVASTYSDDISCNMFIIPIPTASMMLGPLADNGGPTQTIAVGADSILIDEATCLASATTDQRGYTRPATGLETCDVGAYEAGAVNPIQTTTLSSVSGSGTYQGTATLTARLAVGGTGVAGKSIAFTLNGTNVGSATTGGDGVATLSGVSLAGIAAGSYPGAVGASFAGDAGYTGSSGNGTLTVGQTTATIGLDVATLSQTFSGSPRVVTATTSPAGLGHSITYNGGTTPPTDAGSYAVVATITDPNFAGSTSGTLTIDPADQTITVGTPPPASATYGTTFTVAATASSGLTVSYTGSGACSNSGNLFTMTSGSGDCTVTFAQAGNSNVNAATSVVATVAAGKADQSINFTSVAPVDAIYGATYTPTATGGGSGSPIIVAASGACTFDSGTGVVTMTATGICTVTADQAGDANYTAADQQTQSFSVARASLDVTANDVTMIYGDAVPVFDATATGLANGDTFDGLGGTCLAEVAGDPVTASTPPGIYPAAITCFGVDTTNYIVTYTAGTLTVAEAPAFTSDPATTFTVGVAGTFTVTASGVPDATFSTVGPLPAGVSLGSDGVLAGTPEAGTDGIHSFEIVATNGIAPDARQSFTLTVVVPEIIAPDDMTVPNDTGFAGAVVSYPAPGTIGDVGEVTCTPESGSFFALGTTTVTCVSSLTPATDAFTITVVDTVPPTIVAPSNIVVAPTSPDGLVVNYPAPGVTDNAPGVTVVCNPPSGSLFPIGVTTVTCTATDGSGNSASASFSVSVMGGAVLLEQLETTIEDLPVSGTSSTAASIRRNLLAMVAVAQVYEAANQTGLTCLQLTRIDLEVRMQVSKRRITSADAAILYAQTNTIRAAIGCGVP